MDHSRTLVLASTSPYRKDLLKRLGLPFKAVAPRVKEAVRKGESPAATALRLAEAKARAVAARFPRAVVVGADQVASLGASRLDKPGSHRRAVEQLRHVSGKTVQFHTAVAVLDARRIQSRVVRCRVTFRDLDESRIEAYLRRERPYDCAGSAKSEGLGIALIERIEGSDPTALVGLPLIALTQMLERAGFSVL